MDQRAQRLHLARISARRERNRLRSHSERIPKKPSERSKDKAKHRQVMLDQIEQDKLNGLENGDVCRAHYRKLKRRMKPMRFRKTKARGAKDYRSFLRNATRGRAWLACKLQRIKRGETRREYDPPTRGGAQGQAVVIDPFTFAGLCIFTLMMLLFGAATCLMTLSTNTRAAGGSTTRARSAAVRFRR